MIDWVTAVIPCRHQKIDNGHVIKVDHNGQIERCFATRRRFKGSFDSSIGVASNDVSECGLFANTLFFEGNPAKFLQGHNIIGSDNLNALVLASVRKIFEGIGQVVDDMTEWKILNGEYVIKRIDITHYFDCGSYQNVGQFIDGIAKKSRTRSGRPTKNKGTVYLNKHSKRWAFKFYSKFDEISSGLRGHEIPRELYNTPLVEFCRDKVRAELVLRRLELLKLAQLENQYASDIYAHQIQDKLLTFFNDYMGKVDMNAQMTAMQRDVLQLPNHLRGVYTLWKEGHDIRENYSKSQFYKNRRQLQELLDIDIGLPPVDKTDVAHNVIPLIRVVEAKPADIPDHLITYIYK